MGDRGPRHGLGVDGHGQALMHGGWGPGHGHRNPSLDVPE